MENPAVSGLRSRSRSKTPLLRSSVDHEAEEPTQKSGRKTPIKRSTPIKQLGPTTKITEMITESIEEHISAPAHRTRQSTRNADTAITSDYSSEDGMERLRGYRKEIYQNEVNSRYERDSDSRQGYSAFDDVTLSPIPTSSFNVNQERSTRSPATSFCSTDSSFAEQALADSSALLNADPSNEHLPSRLYKMAGEYWNKYPKTDYTYSPLSKDRVELAPGQIAMPNMSRRSLSQFRIQGPNVSADEVDQLAATTAWTTSTLRKRYTSIDSSDDEGTWLHNGATYTADQRWWITRLLITIITTITTTTTNTFRKVVGPAHRYPYTDRRPAKASIISRTATVAAAPFYWIYTLIKEVVTTTVTTVTETITPNHVAQTETEYIARPMIQAKRRWWPLLLLLLLPAVGYGSHYSYQNWDHIVPNFTDFHLDLTEFTNKLPEMPNITFADLNILPKINLTMPDMNITLPDFSENIPEVRKTYNEYKDIVHNRVADATDYIKVIAESCFEEIRRFWRGVI